MRTRWIVFFIGVLLAFPASAASDSTNVVRDLASRVGPVVGAAVACRARSTAQAAASAVHAAATFIEKIRDGLLYGNVSAAGATSLAGELMPLGPRFTNGVIVTQIVPAIAGRHFSTDIT
jgi:branched-chain amino acid transport system substrate-binding protein